MAVVDTWNGVDKNDVTWNMGISADSFKVVVIEVCKKCTVYSSTTVETNMTMLLGILYEWAGCMIL